MQFPSISAAARAVAQLTDWMFVRDCTKHGADTLRAMLPVMPAAQTTDATTRLAPAD